jgi:hypothetical protein
VLDSGEEATLPIGLNFFWPDAWVRTWV